MTFSELPAAWLPFIDSVVKATLVLGAAAVTAHGLRHGTAALRHLIWTLALVSALIIPALSIALPPWQLPLVTVASPEPMPARVDEPVAAASPELRSKTMGNGQLQQTGAASQAIPATAAAATPLSGRISDIPWPRVLIGIWACGFLLIVGRVIVGLIAVRWMARRGERVLDAPWMRMAVSLASEVGVSSNITFLRSPRATMPMACGVVRPAVMMPAEADDWPTDRLRIVLLHELAHVKRRDCLTHLLAQLACAFHWFNPLAWIAARNVRTERERACDDLVLAAGTRAPDYADQLLDIARTMRADRYPAVLAGASLAMAHRSQLEGRLMAILDPRVSHSALSRLRAAAATAVCCAAVVPLAALQPWGQEIPIAPIAVVAPSIPQESPQTPSPAPQPLPVPRPSQAPGERALTETATAIAGSVAEATLDGSLRGTISGTLGGTLGGTVHGTIHGVMGAMLGEAEGTDNRHNSGSDKNHSNQDQETKPASAKSDPRMVAALTAALKDTDKEVRETALHALVRMRDPAIFEPLLQALKDAAPDVRERAAFGLGQLRDRRAVEPLSAALKDEHADVREQAAFALSQLRDRAAIPALTAALKDADAEVREQVLFALSQFRDPAAIEGFALALRDTSANVREKAAFALGQLRDRRALEPLISALKDGDAEVREQAAFALGQLRDRGAVEALVMALKDSSADVREQAAFALGQLRDARAIDGLTAALKDPQASVRQQAAFALGQLAR